MNKSVLTNLTAILIIFIGLFPIYNEIIFLLDFLLYQAQLQTG